MFSMDPAG